MRTSAISITLRSKSASRNEKRSQRWIDWSTTICIHTNGIIPSFSTGIKAFLTYFARKKYQNDEEKNEFFNSFIYRVVLFDDCVYIFYNTSPDVPTKVKLDKDELDELKSTEHRKSTRLEPLGFKLGANGGERGIRTPGQLPVNGFQDRRIRPLCHLSKNGVAVSFTVPLYHFFRNLQHFSRASP